MESKLPTFHQWTACLLVASMMNAPLVAFGQQAKPAAKPAKAAAQPAAKTPEPAKPAAPAAKAPDPATPAATEVSPEVVAKAIEKGIAYLLSKQNEEGTWEAAATREVKGGHNDQTGGQWGGATAIATYSLLTAGVKPTDPKLVPAIEFLKKAPLVGVYAIACRALVWPKLPRTPEVRAAAQRDANLLLEMVQSQGDARGFYNYTLETRNTGDYSHSRSQYGVLGIWAASQVGVTIPDQYWQVVEDAWIAHQQTNGGWSYKAAGKATGEANDTTAGMTAAAVATLFITQDYLHSSDGLQPRGNITNPAIDKGLAWMASHMNEVARGTKHGRDFPNPTLYAVERIGMASGRKYIGSTDWYQRGAEYLVRTQAGQGYWTGQFGNTAETAFGLLFLARGRSPVMMNKLEYQVTGRKGQSEPGAWNQRPRDVANITRWVSGNIERELNWQVVNLSGPLDDLLEAPILYVSGSGELNLSEKDRQKIKAFIEAGGMVIGNSDGGRPQFVESFKKLGESLLDRKFRELPADHVIYTNQQYPRTKWRVVPQVYGLSNGSRELMIISSMDMGRSWQSGKVLPAEAFQLPANIFLYAVDKQNLKLRGESYYVKADPSKTTDKSLKVARLHYKGNWDPEPGGWARIAGLMQNQQKTKLAVEVVTLGEAKLAGVHRIAHLTGTDEVKFTDAERKDISDFVKQGGTLIVDAAGGQGAFAASIETELATAFGMDTAKSLSVDLPADHALFKAGKEIKEWDYRPYVRVKLGSMPKAPRLRGMEVAGRLSVIYSPMDMSTGLVGQQIDGIYGYAPQTATQLMQNLLVYAGANR